MPMCFKYAFGNKVTVIIDCFEVFTEKPTNLLARARTFNSYKHQHYKNINRHHPSRIYISEAWGGGFEPLTSF